ncbi:hypothetical protein [Ensifer soli]|uniref:hypothetical protein n=1 Tax=Ciceribacter sp. sgz301302 TaxID=3342379 RepID=UPI0035B6BF2C
MPEEYRRGLVHPYRHARLWTLRKAAEIGQLVRVTCKRCRVTRTYMCGDLATLLGDIEVRDVEQRMRCEGCGSKDYLAAKTLLPSAEERQTMVIRRLVEVKTRRVPIWQDVKGG